MKKILIIAGLVLGLGYCGVAFARSAVMVFNDETVEGVTGVADEVATSTGFHVDGVTSIGFDYYTRSGTSTPHITIGYQTSMNNSSWTATVIAVSDSTVADTYTATDTAITLPPTEWIRWILQTELLNATDTAVTVFMKEKKE